MIIISKHKLKLKKAKLKNQPFKFLYKHLYAYDITEAKVSKKDVICDYIVDIPYEDTVITATGDQLYLGGCNLEVLIGAKQKAAIRRLAETKLKEYLF